jgi:hypothetical protein
MEQNLNGKKLLVLAGAAVHCKVVETAKKMGIYTIVTDYLVDSPAKKIADEAWLLNIFDIDAIVERCRREKVDGVIEFCIDPAQRPYQEICEKLNLPCYCTSEQVLTMTDKNLFKKYCVQHGVDVIPEYSEIDIEQDRVEYPVLIKPVLSRGSRGQTVCFSKKDTIQALSIAKSESNDGKAIIEKYMGDKQDITLSYLVVDGIPYKTKIGDRYLGNVKDRLDKQCISTISPSRYTDKYIEKVEPRVRAMIASLGIKFGPVFLQGFVDGETVRFYDPGLRFPGGDFDLALRDITGFDTMKSLIQFALTGDFKRCFGNPLNAFRLNDHIVIQLTLSARSGVIGTYEGFDEIAKLPYVVSVSKRSSAGEKIPASGDVRQRVTEIMILAPDKMSAKATVKDVYSKLRVLDNKGENMLVSLLDVELLDKY